MDPTPATPEQPRSIDETAPSRRAWPSIVGFIVGIGLLACAIVALLGQRDEMGQAYEAARSRPWWLVAAVVLLPIVNIALTGLSFVVVTRRRGRVGIGEMIGLIWTASLLNQLPLRPGMVGRLAYHRSVNGIRVGDSLKAMVEIIACAAVATGLMIAVVAVTAITNAAPSILMLAAAVAAASLLLLTLVLRAVGANRSGAWVHAWRYALTVAIRYVDVLVWATRYALVFMLVGWNIDVRGAAAVAAAGQGAMMAPVPFGLREWVVGVTSAWMPEEYWQHHIEPSSPTSSSIHTLPGLVERSTPGLMADVTNRAAELAVCVPGGLIAGAWLMRRWRRTGPMQRGASITRSAQTPV
jgi:hypothetical protein